MVNVKSSRKVAPHTGAWIETLNNPTSAECPIVAPHTGAWIETLEQRFNALDEKVAPHTGAWIETSRQLAPLSRPRSPLTQGRGLKPHRPR